MVKKEAKRFIEAEGKTSQEAIKAALRQLGTTRDKVVVKILCEAKSGLYGMGGSKPAKVRVSMK